MKYTPVPHVPLNHLCTLSQLVKTIALSPHFLPHWLAREKQTSLERQGNDQRHAGLETLFGVGPQGRTDTWILNLSFLLSADVGVTDPSTGRAPPLGASARGSLGLRLSLGASALFQDSSGFTSNSG